MSTTTTDLHQKRYFLFKLFGPFPLTFSGKAKTSKFSTTYSIAVIILSAVLIIYGMLTCVLKSIFSFSGISEMFIITTPPFLVLINILYRSAIKKTLNGLIHIENKLIRIGIITNGSGFRKALKANLFAEISVVTALTIRTLLIFYNFGNCFSLLPSLLFLLAISASFHLQNYLILFLFVRRFVEINQEIELLPKVSEVKWLIRRILVLMDCRKQLTSCMEFYTKPLGFEIMFLVLGNAFFFITAAYLKLSSIRDLEREFEIGDYAPMGMVVLDTYILIMLIRKSKLVIDAVRYEIFSFNVMMLSF